MGYIINPYAYAGSSFENLYSMAFDGVDDFISCGPATYLDGLTTATISLWVQPLTTGITDVIRRGNTSSSDIRIWIYPSSDRIDFGIGSSIARTTSTTLNVGTWYHIFACYDTSLASKDMILYVDGVEQASANTSVVIATGTEDLIIGENFYNSNCKVDEVALWTTDQRAEVSTVYNSGVPNNLNDLTTPPTTWYRQGESGIWKSPQWLLPQNSNKDKYSNYSFSLDGIGDRFSFGDIPFLKAGGSYFSISMWVKVDTTTQRGFFGARSATPHQINFYINTIGKLILQIKNGTSGDITETSTSALANDTWLHIGATFDGTESTASDRIKLYVNGSAVASSTTGTGTNLPNGGVTVVNYIGSTFSGIRMVGEIGDSAIWDSTLTAGNMTSIYNSGEPTTLLVTPVAHWKMGTDATFSTSWTVPDSIGSFDLTSQNMTIEDRVGEAPNSNNNSVSYNMDEVDRETDVP